MLVRICAFTDQGRKLTDYIKDKVFEYTFEVKQTEKNLDEWIADCFSFNIPIIFIGAIGIAVRKIAPYENNKLTDSPVIVIDELGQFVVPILSNHVGKANEISKLIGKAINGQVVLTTATDVNNIFAIDVFAVKNGLKIVNKDGIKEVSAKLLKKGFISMSINPLIKFNVDDIPSCIKLLDYPSESSDVLIDTLSDESKEHQDKALLKLIYKPFIIGVGCKKDTDVYSFKAFVENELKKNKVDMSLVCSMASIDIKREERALLYFEALCRIPFYTYTAYELEQVEGSFSESDFVKKTTGVSNVCERAAMKQAGDNAQLLIGKTAKDGMTLAISRREERINIWET